MFDYQAGEKFKLTLIMVGFAGLMAGMLFTMLVMPSGPDPAVAKHRPRPKWMDNPDVTGGGSKRPYERAQNMAAAALPSPAPGADPMAAQELVEKWLPYAWDLSAASATSSQAEAMKYMTPECAALYRRNIWTDELAKQVTTSGVQSKFQLTNLQASTAQSDGSVVVFVQGQQVLNLPGKGQKVRPVNFKYMVKQTAAGLKVAGMDEG